MAALMPRSSSWSNIVQLEAEPNARPVDKQPVEPPVPGLPETGDMRGNSYDNRRRRRFGREDLFEGLTDADSQ